MKFEKWVEDQGGTTQVAAKLGIETMTVHHWICGRTSPKAVTMQKLVHLGRGAFSYDDVINLRKKGVKR